MQRHLAPVQLASIELFCKAAELGGFTAAARALGVTPAAVSRAIGRLEARLAVQLFTRTTRQIQLTEAGHDYYHQCSGALTQIEEAERALTGRQSEPAGTVRISVPTTYGHHRLLPLLPRFLAQYPEVRIEAHVGNRNIDFVQDGYDLAIRLGLPDDGRLIARPLEYATPGVFAAPAYLAARGTPASLNDLAQHDCVAFVLPSSGRAMPWSFLRDGEEIALPVSARLWVEEDVLACVGHARAGGGLCQIYHYIAAEYVARGELVEVLQPYAGRARPFSLLYPQNRHRSASVRAFIDFVLAELATPSGHDAARPAGRHIPL
ncbi:LysR family transcriptional regulator [Chitinolyticbacter albus]|uniref:LysR family transcriptional regulator n=1 Tax=Chitinolyticbacter albus TaxID=2961951 RepID=UPI00210EF3A7|nr:LysR family transcriptional regulator [Chitinolyticbacter albus]